MKSTFKTPTATSAPRVLVVDRDANLAETVADGLVQLGFDTAYVTSSREAARLLGGEPIDALVTNLRMPELDGIDLLRIARLAAPSCPVILMTECGTVDLAVAAMRQGAYHYLLKPFLVRELALFLERALEQERVRNPSVLAPVGAVRALTEPAGSSSAMQALRDLIRRVAASAASVVISGEMGTGKQLVARAIHGLSPRRAGPFLALNCGTVTEGDLERELFTRCDSSAASASRPGLLDRASGGTLFLDDIAAMTLPLQAKLLHVLEGGAVDVRIMAATRTSPRDDVKKGTFREDLVYRLEVINVHVPPLRSRSEDIPELVEQLLALARSRHPDSKVERFSPEAMSRLRAYPWPGNVRELEDCVEELVLRGSGVQIEVAELPPAMGASEGAPVIFQGEILPLREVGRLYARWAYQQAGWKKTVAAERLQIDYKTLNKMLLPDADDSGDESQVTG